jgi:hypothetical protein
VATGWRDDPAQAARTFSELLRRRGLHRFAQAQRPHVGPHRLDELQTIDLLALLAGVVPPGRRRAARRVRAVCRPDRVLIFVVDDYTCKLRVFLIVVTHLLLLDNRTRTANTRVSRRWVLEPVEVGMLLSRPLVRAME